MFEAKAKHHLVNKFRTFRSPGCRLSHKRPVSRWCTYRAPQVPYRHRGVGPLRKSVRRSSSHRRCSHAWAESGCAVNGIAKCLCTVFSSIVGIPAIVGNATTRQRSLPSSTKQFVPVRCPRGRYLPPDIPIWLSKCDFHKTIQPGKILVGPPGTLITSVPGGEAGQRIRFTLHDDALLAWAMASML